MINYAYLKNVKFAQTAMKKFVQKYLKTGGSPEQTENLRVLEQHGLLNFFARCYVVEKPVGRESHEVIHLLQAIVG
mgnify:FL=1